MKKYIGFLIIIISFFAISACKLNINKEKDNEQPIKKYSVVFENVNENFKGVQYEVAHGNTIQIPIPYNAYYIPNNWSYGEDYVMGFSGWIDQDGNVLTAETIITKDLQLKALYSKTSLYTLEIAGQYNKYSESVIAGTTVSLNMSYFNYPGYKCVYFLDDTTGEKYTNFIQINNSLNLTAVYEKDLDNYCFINYYINNQLYRTACYEKNSIVENYISTYENNTVDYWTLQNGEVFEFGKPITNSIDLYAHLTPIILPEKSCADDETQDKCKDPDTWDWEYNRTGFNGKNMQILILSEYPENLDPFRNYFTSYRKREKQLQLYQIEQAYSVDIVIDKYPDEAAWGPDRVAWLKYLASNQIENEGDIFEIASDWVPSLVGGNSIAELASFSKKKGQTGGIFGELGYIQADEKNKLYANAGKVYGYSNGKDHADAFLYYNQDLVEKYSLEDPATLWNEGKWDFSYFYQYLGIAQQAFDASGEEEKTYAFGGYVNEVAQCMLAARGGKFVDPDMEKVLFINQTTLDLYADLRNIRANYGWAPGSTWSDLSEEFVSGHCLFTQGFLWFLTSEIRFASEDINFNISAVPYPTANGDATAKEHYTIPMGSDFGYAFRNVSNGANGLTTKVLVNIMDDLCRGLGPEFSTLGMTEEQQYRAFLQRIIDSEASIDAIMSVENNISKYGYTDYLWVLSKSVGNGSDWQGSGFATWGMKLVTGDEDPAVALASYQPIYESKLKEILNVSE